MLNGAIHDADQKKLVHLHLELDGVLSFSEIRDMYCTFHTYTFRVKKIVFENLCLKSQKINMK